MRWYDRALSIFLLLVGALVAVTLFGATTGLYRSTTVLTGSMQPTIRPGDVVIDVPVRAANVKAGDIITFRQPDGAATVTHRVVSVRHQNGDVNIQTRGDANRSDDTFHVTLRDGTAWKTRFVVPKAGYAFVAVRSVLANRLFLPIIGLLLLASVLRTIWRQPEACRECVDA